jgi:hypothetical protein
LVEIHVTNKISDDKQASNYRIIEIDIASEDDIRAFSNKLLSHKSEKIKLFNFKTPTKLIDNDGKCKKTFLFLFLKTNGSVLFKQNISLVKIYNELNHNNDIVEYRIIAPDHSYGYEDYDFYWEYSYLNKDEYKPFIAYCVSKNLNVKSCFICRYHAPTDSMWSTAPIFCKYLKKECKSTEAVKCGSFRKEDKYVKELINQQND